MEHFIDIRAQGELETGRDRWNDQIEFVNTD